MPTDDEFYEQVVRRGRARRARSLTIAVAVVVASAGTATALLDGARRSPLTTAEAPPSSTAPERQPRQWLDVPPGSLDPRARPLCQAVVEADPSREALDLRLVRAFDSTVADVTAYQAARSVPSSADEAFAQFTAQVADGYLGVCWIQGNYMPSIPCCDDPGGPLLSAVAVRTDGASINLGLSSTTPERPSPAG